PPLTPPRPSAAASTPSGITGCHRPATEWRMRRPSSAMTRNSILPPAMADSKSGCRSRASPPATQPCSQSSLLGKPPPLCHNGRQRHVACAGGRESPRSPGKTAIKSGKKNGRIRMANIRVLATDLEFPEGPVVMPDGSVVLVEIRGQRLTRVYPDGRKDVVAQMPGGPNGAALGPDGKIYVCNNGG